MTSLERDKLNIDLSPLDGARILMTGGTGFVGRSMLDVLQRHIGKTTDVLVYVVTRDPIRFVSKSPDLASHNCVILWKGDAAHCPETDFTHLVHLENCNSVTTALLAHRAAQRRAPMLYASSGAAYGDNLPLYIDEQFIPRPKSHYGWEKWYTESQCKNIADYVSSRFVSARMFAFSGKYLPLRPFAIGNFVENGLRHEAICVNGSGLATRSYLDSEDLGRWLWMLLMHGRGTYNVGSEQAITIRELAFKVSNHFDYAPEVILKRDPDVPETVYVPSTRKANDELGLSQTVALNESIERMIRYAVGEDMRKMDKSII